MAKVMVLKIEIECDPITTSVPAIAEALEKFGTVKGTTFTMRQAEATTGKA